MCQVGLDDVGHQSISLKIVQYTPYSSGFGALGQPAFDNRVSQTLTILGFAYSPTFHRSPPQAEARIQNQVSAKWGYELCLDSGLSKSCDVRFKQTCGPLKNRV